MSHFPPNGPPGPYYGYPHHAPPPGSYAYMPAPVMMPMPAYHHAPPPMQPAPDTYVTNNYIYQQPVQPTLPPQPESFVRVVEEVIDWVPATPNTAHTFEPRAVKAGYEGWDGSPLWVIRAHHGGDLVPGKIAIKHRAAFIAYCGKEMPVHNFEVLCAQPGATRWLPASNGQVPVGAIAAGNTVSAEPLYIGRVKHLLSQTPGKVHPSHGCCYISYNGQEVSYKHYEILCKIVG